MLFLTVCCPEVGGHAIVGLFSTYEIAEKAGWDFMQANYPRGAGMGDGPEVVEDQAIFLVYEMLPDRPGRTLRRLNAG
jgi:hypothetical protein